MPSFICYGTLPRATSERIANELMRLAIETKQVRRLLESAASEADAKQKQRIKHEIVRLTACEERLMQSGRAVATI